MLVPKGKLPMVLLGNQQRKEVIMGSTGMAEIVVVDLRDGKQRVLWLANDGTAIVYPNTGKN